MTSTLWNQLSGFTFDHSEAEFSFRDRLARENGWSVAFTDRVIEEYRRFLYLCCEAGHAVTPSDEVDQAWHLHLCYTRSYWEDLCRDTLGRKIHHGPTRGGDAEKEKFHDWYEATLTSYREHFGEAPPCDIWPPAKKRFASRNFRRIDLRENLVLSRKATALGCGVLLAGTLVTGCFIWEGGGWKVIVGLWAVLAVVLIAMLYFRNGGGGGGKNGCSAGLGCGGCSGCGGCGG